MTSLRTTALVLTVCMFFEVAPSVHALFIDVAERSEREAIEELKNRGVIEGYRDGTFRPDAPINRAEFLKILIESRFQHHLPADLRCFRDLEVKTPQWYARAVCSARELGVVAGYPDGFFRPDRTVNLAEALKMALGSFGIFPKVETSEAWYEALLTEARNRNILVSLLKNPSHLLTRGEMATLTYALVLAAEEPNEDSKDVAGVCGNGIEETPEQCDDGNVKDSDGCSSICILVPEPVFRAIVQIDAQATGTVTTIAQGQRHVTLLKFNAVSGRQDALLTSLTFSPSVGLLVFGQHYTLLMDRDGTGNFAEVVQANGKTDGTHLVFDQLKNGGILIPKGLSISFALTADLVSTLGPVSLGVNFATDLPDYVQAQGAVDGIPLTGIETNNACISADCFIRVNTQATTDINVVERGSLFVTEDPIPAQSHILVGGTLSPALLRLRMHAVSEAIDLRELRIDGVPNNVDSLLLYRLEKGANPNLITQTPFAQASNGQCSSQSASRLCAILGLSTLVIKENEDIVIAVAARMKSDQVGGVSGQNLSLSIAGATDDAGLAIRARGISSNQDLTQNNGDSSAIGEVIIGSSVPKANTQITGRTFDSALASIGAIANAGSVSSTVIPSGNAVIGSFRIDALAHTNSKSGLNDVVLQTLTFHVSARNVQLDPAGYRLSASDDASLEHSCSAAGTTGDITVTCAGLGNGAIRNRIGQGQFAIFSLKANVTNTQITQGSSSLQIELPTLGTRAETNSVIWSDEDTVFTWVDIPVSGVSSTLYRTQ